MEAKEAIRKSMKAALKEMSPQQKTMESFCIVAKLASHPAIKNAGTVMLYSPLPSEPDITPLHELLAEKTLLLPCVSGDDIIVKRWNSADNAGTRNLTESTDTHKAVSSMRTGSFGIMEPDTDETFEALESIDAVLVPGVAFTKEGIRLGRGKAYYDRFLQKLPSSTVKIGVCFGCQLHSTLPSDPWDIKMDEVI